MTMKNPPHPGLSVRHDCIEALDLTITEAAEILGVTRQTLNNLVNGKSGISADMAIRLDKAFGGGAETWLRLQMAYDLAQARQHEGDINVKPVRRRKLQETSPAIGGCKNQDLREILIELPDQTVTLTVRYDRNNPAKPPPRLLLASPPTGRRSTPTLSSCAVRAVRRFTARR